MISCQRWSRQRSIRLAPSRVITSSPKISVSLTIINILRALPHQVLRRKSLRILAGILVSSRMLKNSLNRYYAFTVCKISSRMSSISLIISPCKSTSSINSLELRKSQRRRWSRWTHSKFTRSHTRLCSQERSPEICITSHQSSTQAITCQYNMESRLNKKR